MLNISFGDIIISDHKMKVFEDQIIDAFKAKVEKSEKTISELEKNLNELQEKLTVKEAELVYVTKSFSEQNIGFTVAQKSLEYKISTLEEKLNKANQTIVEKDTYINDIVASMEDLSDKENLKDVIISSKDEQINKLTAEIEVLLKKDEKLNDKILKQDTEISEKDFIIEEITIKFEKINAELKEFKIPELTEVDLLEGDRLRCPKCDAVGKDIKSVEDKTKPLSYVGNMPMYAKINVCKRCGHEF